MCRGSDRQHARRSLNFDLISKPRNLKQRLRETDASRVPNFHKLRPNHGDLRKACSHCSHLCRHQPLPQLWLTLPLSGRQVLYIASRELMEACPLEGLVVRSSMP